MPISRTRQSTPRSASSPARRAPVAIASASWSRVSAALRHVRGSLRDLLRAHAVRGRTEKPDVGDEEVVTPVAGQHRDRCLASRRRRGDLRRDGGAEEARAVLHVSVVRRAHERAGPDARRRRGSRDRGPALDETLERSQAAGRLDELVEAVARGGRGAAVDGRPAGGCLRHLGAPALAHHDGVEREALGPAGGFETRPQRALVGPSRRTGRRSDRPVPGCRRARAGRPGDRSYPADAEPLGTRREPQVLDRAGGAVDVGLRDRAAAEDLGVLVAVIAASRCRAAPRRSPRPSGRGSGGRARRSDRPPQPLALGKLTDCYPRLDASTTIIRQVHEADRRGAVRCLEQALHVSPRGPGRDGSGGCRGGRR